MVGDSGRSREMIRVAWVGLGLGVMVDGHRVVWCEDRAPRCEVRGVKGFRSVLI